MEGVLTVVEIFHFRLVTVIPSINLSPFLSKVSSERTPSFYYWDFYSKEINEIQMSSSEWGEVTHLMLTLSTVQTFMLVFSWQIHWMQLVVGGVFALDPDNESFTAPAIISSREQHHHTEAEISELLSDTFLDAVSSQGFNKISYCNRPFWNILDNSSFTIWCNSINYKVSHFNERLLKCQHPVDYYK